MWLRININFRNVATGDSSPFLPLVYVTYRYFNGSNISALVCMQLLIYEAYGILKYRSLCCQHVRDISAAGILFVTMGLEL